MSNEYLDLILKTLSENEVAFTGPEFLEIKDINTGSVMESVRLLESRKFIKTYRFDYPPYWNIQITTEGKLFIQNGGFTKEELLRNSPIESNRIANKSYRIAIIAIIISVISLILTLEPFKCNKKQTNQVYNKSSNRKPKCPSYTSLRFLI